jgi:molybdopterin molybdotransferase
MTRTASRLRSVGAYYAEIARSVGPLPARPIALDDADGTVLAEDVAAVRAFSDVSGARPGTPVVLPVQEHIPAGDTRLPRLRPGSCAKVMTGGIVPQGADAVARVEDVGEEGGEVIFRLPVRSGESVPYAGGQSDAGEVLLAAGTLLAPAQLGLLAAAGRAAVLARPKPRVTILSAPGGGTLGE